MNDTTENKDEAFNLFDDDSSTLVQDEPTESSLESEQEIESEELNSNEETSDSQTDDNKPSEIEELQKAIKTGFDSLKKEEPTQDNQEELQKKAEKYIESLKANYSVDDLKALGLINDEDEADLADSRLKTFNDVLQRKQQENLAYTQLLLDQQKRELQEQINPYVSYVQEQQQKQVQDSFFSKYESLKPYQKVVDIVTRQIIESKELQDKNLTPDQVFESVANKTAEYIKEFGNKEFKLSVNQKSPTKEVEKAVKGSIPKPAEMTTGGRNQTNTKSTQTSEDDWVADLTTAII